MKIHAKLLTLAVMIMFITAAGILVSNISFFSNYVDTTTICKIQSATKFAALHLDLLGAESKTAAVDIAEEAAVAKAIACSDRAVLLNRIEEIREKTGVEFCIITDSQGCVIVRSHAPERYGDDFTAHEDVCSALRGQTVVSIGEGENIRLSVRASVPVFDGSGAVTGTVTAGYRLDTPRFVDFVKEATECEATILVDGLRLSTTVKQDGVSAVGTKPDPRIIETALAAGIYSEHTNYPGRRGITTHTPLNGADGRTLGTLYIGISLDGAVTTVTAFVHSGLIITGVTAALLIMAVLIICRRIATPITQLEERDRQLAAALEEAKKASLAKSDFLANMSHEMRTPLNSVIGLSEIALRSSRLDSDARQNLGEIYRSGMTLLNIVNEILDISKIQSGKFNIVPRRYNLPDLINDTVLPNIRRIESRPIRFLLDIDESMPVCLYGDELRVKQIMNNLLSNAVKYTDEGWVKLGVGCEFDGHTVWMTICVSDSGVGMKSEHLARLFSDYEQFGSTPKHRAGGTGLGLVITKSLAEMMGGSITVTSNYGEGSVFTVRLRQGYINSAVIGISIAESLKQFRYSERMLKHSERIVSEQFPSAHVLVVDDNPANLEVAKGLLKPYGMQVDCLSGGDEAVRAIREEAVRYDVVFMDHMMPGIDGIETTRQIREEIGSEYAKTVPIVALTANAITGSEEMFLSNGFQGYISKPIDVSRLDAIINRFIIN